MLSRLLAGVLLISAAAAQGRVFVVDEANGAGTHFTDLISAIASPQVVDGDVLQVRAGVYASAPISKGIAIVAAGPGVMIDTPLGGPALTVQQLTAAQTFAVHGVRLYSNAVAQVTVRACAGRVVFERVEIVGVGSTTPSLSVVDCNQVMISGSRLTNGSLVAERSRVFCSDSNLQGGGGYPSGQVAIPAGPGVLLRQSTGTFAKCTISGGDWGPATVLPDGPVGAGIHAEASTVEIRGDATSWVGAGVYRGPGVAVGVPAARGLAGSSLLYDLSIPMRAAGGMSVVFGFSTATLLRMPALTVVGAPIGGTVRTSLYSPLGSQVFFVAGLPTTGVFTPPLFGACYLNLAGPLVIASLGPQVPGEHIFFDFPLPVAPELRGVSLMLQYVNALPAIIQWSNPVALLIR